MVLTSRDLQEIIDIYLRWPSSWRYLDLLQHADESQKGRNGLSAIVTLLHRSGLVKLLFHIVLIGLAILL